MNYKLLSTIMIVLVVFGFNTHAQAITTAKINNETIKLHVGAVQLVNVGKVIRVAVGIDNILATSILDNQKLLLIPKQAGETDLTIWTEGDRLVNYRIMITANNVLQNVSDISNVLRDYPLVTVRSVNGLVILEGEVAPEKFAVFTAIASGFTGVISKVIPTVLVMKDMINFKIQVLEVNKNYAKDVGISWSRSFAGPNIGYVKNIHTNGKYVVTNPDDSFGEDLFDKDNPIIGFNDQSTYAFLGIASSITSRINLLKEDGAARILAEPQLSTRNGEIATFHSGGSYPLAVLNEFGQPVVQMQDYGIRLTIEPLSDDKENIVSSISAEMSSLDFSTVVNGVPGMLIRKTESVVNLRAGETLIISGLVQTSDSKAVEKVPFLGDIPILGELFKSKQFSEKKTELIILVTPTIVQANMAISEDLAKHRKSIRKVLEKSEIEDELLL